MITREHKVLNIASKGALATHKRRFFINFRLVWPARIT